jgi:hypothetical protein
MPLETHHAGLQACPATVGASALTAGVTPHVGLELPTMRLLCEVFITFDLTLLP